MKTVNFPHYVTIRLSEEQLDKLKINSSLAGQTESEYIRNLVDNGKTPVHYVDKEAVRQINKFGNILNQVAAKLNSGDSLDSNALIKIEQIRSSIDILVNCILNKNSKYIVKTSSNLANQGTNASQGSCADNIQEKSIEKIITEPTPSYNNTFKESAISDESLDRENYNNIDGNVDSIDNIQICSDSKLPAIQSSIDTTIKHNT